nr:DEAD/DEAH box helicase [Pseudoclavibacter chungangensis]
MLPTIQADEIRDGLIEYLTTTFALADRAERRALDEFLKHPEQGIFKGPYLRLRLPFRPAANGTGSGFAWLRDFTPHGHQAAAFERLSSAELGPDKPRPLPTLVTTGTGSGKTESFLFPILDHVVRAKAAGETGIKALILYPMNALANDQADRVTRLIRGTPELAGIRAAIYTGQGGPKRGQVTDAGLITDRETMRSQAPDILLTNYKMLDQLLLRPADQALWRQSATSLRYLVLDEFHSYDGAQGTDVAMLLRRLGLALKRHWPDEDPRIDDHARAATLGLMTPVATSATLGGGDDPAAMVEFANTVFGGGFDRDSVVTETRLELDEWADGAAERVAALGLTPRTDANACAEELIDIARGPDAARYLGAADARQLTMTVLGTIYRDHDGGIPALAEFTPEQLLDLTRAHPWIRVLIGGASDPRATAALARHVVLELTPGRGERERDADRHLVLTLVVAALSHVRAIAGRAAATVEVHQWVRALTRLDRVAGPSTAYRWSDDGATDIDDNDDPFSDAGRVAFPAIYCRHCGRTGWGVLLAPTGTHLNTDDSDIRGSHLRREGRFRALLYAPNEADQALTASPGDPPVEGLAWFDAVQRCLLPEAPDADELQASTDILPVLTLGPDPNDERSNRDTCPSCGQIDGIRFLGSAIATLLSVTVTTIFGDAALDAGEKKALVFTDSVQDAAHRAAFVQSRSHVFNLRNAMREAVGDETTTLADLVETMLVRADTPERRYRILSPDLVEREQFKPFWHGPGATDPAVKRRVRRRLAFDAAMEFGLQASVGRTLVRTGSLVCEVDAGPTSHLHALARTAIREYETATPILTGVEATAADGALVHWVRGVLERMRERGAIAHPWFRKYLQQNGARWPVWGGRPRGEGMPAFPPDREAPAYPRFGSTRVAGGHDSGLDPAGAAQGWYARWASRTLGVSPMEGPTLTKLLFDALAEADIVSTVATGDTGGTAYQLEPARILLEAAPHVDDHTVLLHCETCQGEVRGTRRVRAQLDGAPCTAIRCTGTLVPGTDVDNYYRRLYDEGEMRRVVAHEHTSLLDDAVRREVEDGFKQSAADPDAPNVLVATPTLEMGIDIGDLSTVFLAGLPNSVASYLQRVGRAGRLTGNALVMAFVVGRGEQLPKLGDPLSVIGGEVRPPATYLSAEEILRRQYTAFLIDRLASRGELADIARAADVLANDAPGSFLDQIITDAETNAHARLTAFLDTFDGLREWAVDTLRAWANPGAEPRTSGLAGTLLTAAGRWQREVDELGQRKTAIAGTLDELQTKAEHPAATTDDHRAFRSAKASYAIVAKQQDTLRTDHWVGALERAGILPNYTLLDDRVRLDVGLSWIDPDTQEYETREASYERGASIAITELAPGNVFYAQGVEIEIDAVELGRAGSAVRSWAYCPSCGYARDLDAPEAETGAACPRCGSPAIADTNQIVPSLELERVSAEVRRDESSIGDRNEERRRERFTVQLAADLDPSRLLSQWFVEDGHFGIKYYRDLTIRWINLGRQAAYGGGERTIAGAGHANTPLFRVCDACGKLDLRGDENTEHEHRAWCPNRKVREEHVVSLALTRTLVSQGVVMRLPQAVTIGDRLALPSLAAAIQLGLREVIGGDPDHLRIEVIEEPLTGTDGQTATSLLIHDIVPGGTGYLADLAARERIREVLDRAFAVVRDCPCADEGRLACHRCLLPYAPGNRAELVSRESAQRVLSGLLTDAETGEPEEWKTTEIDPGVEDPESNLEQWFRKVFIERAATAGATVKELPGTWGNTLRVTFPAGGRAWQLTPQQRLGGVQPDFLLEAVGGGVAPIAIFTDGRRYHATHAHNRLADDATKRNTLRLDSTHVFAITWDDVRRADERGGEPVDVSSWFARGAIEDLAAAQGLTRDDLDAVSENPITLLFRWMQTGGAIEERWRKLANLLPLLLRPTSRRTTPAAELDALALRASGILDGLDEDGPANSPTMRLRRGPLVMVTTADVATRSTRSALVLDDRDAAVEAPDAPAAWALWLRLSNLLGFADAHRVAITTVERVMLGAVDRVVELRPGIAATGPQLTASTLGPVDIIAMTPEWIEALEFATDEERAILEPIAARGGTVPELGIEQDGIPLPIAWPDARIVVDLHFTDDDRALLSEAGWRIVPTDTEPIMTALEQKD